MSTDTTVSPLRQRMIEDMAARKLGRHAQRSHIHSCRRFAAFLGRSPDTATADDVRRFQLHLVESGLSIGAFDQVYNRQRLKSALGYQTPVAFEAEHRAQTSATASLAEGGFKGLRKSK